MLLEWMFVYTHFSLSQTFFVTKREALGLIVFFLFSALFPIKYSPGFYFLFNEWLIYFWLWVLSCICLKAAHKAAQLVDNCLYTGEFLLYFNVNTI